MGNTQAGVLTCLFWTGRFAVTWSSLVPAEAVFSVRVGFFPSSVRERERECVCVCVVVVVVVLWGAQLDGFILQ